MAYIYTYDEATELYHHGILGMHWGIRRYQNKDGSLTKAGERRYRKYQKKLEKKTKKMLKDANELARLSGANPVQNEQPAKEETPHYQINPRNVNPDRLTDAELSRVNTRLSYQNTFESNLKQYNEKHASVASKFYKSYLKEPAENIAKSAIKEYTYQFINKAVGYELMDTKKNKSNNGNNNENNNGNNNENKKKKKE